MIDQQSGWHLRVVLLLAWLVLLFLALPILITIPISLTPNRYVSVPSLGELSLNPYRTVFASWEWLHGIMQSTIIGLAASLFAVIVGTTFAIGLWRLASRIAQTLRWLALAPLIVPQVVSALAFFRLWVDIERLTGIQFLDSYIGMIVAHGILGIPFVVIPVSTSLANLDQRIEQAARGLGANIWQTLFYVILPNIKSGIAAGAAAFAFVLSWDEIVVNLFISGRDIVTVPRLMWEGVRERLDPAVAAVASMFIVLTVVSIVITMVLQARRGRGARRAT